jgi:hypothetical protein
MKRFALALLAAIFVVPVAAGQAAGTVEWKCLDGRPGMVGLWVDGKYAGQLDPASGKWTFHTGRQLDLQSHVKEFNPAKPADKPVESKPTVSVSQRAATVRTANFIVTADSQADADEFAVLAEGYRKQRAIDWLGKEMPQWSEPCPLRVSVADTGGSGVTRFTFDGGRVRSQEMEIKGPRDRLKNAILAHEITHTVLAYAFGRPVPRWADEGAAVYSEDDIERARHDKIVVKILNSGEGIKLAHLFRMKDYPRDGRDVMALYAQGYSVVRYLAERSGRPAFLAFVSKGMDEGWESAAKSIGFASVEDLEAQWLDYLRKGGPTAATKCKCGNLCPGSSCKCGCRNPLPFIVNYWWIVPAASALIVTLALAKRRNSNPEA